MSRIRTYLAAFGWGLTLCSAGAAQADRALVIGAPEAARRGLFGSGGGVDIGQSLRDAGFSVITANAGSVSDMRAALSEFLSGVDAEPRLVIALSGSFVTGTAGNWFLQTDTEAGVNLATIGNVGLSVETVLAVAARVPGGAVVALGMESGGIAPGDGLNRGLGELDVPQGVTVVTGRRPDVADFLADDLLQEGQSLPDALAKARGVTGLGFLAAQVPFLPLGEARPVAPPNAAEVERAIWQAALEQDSVAAYEGYLGRYPDGFFLTEARQRIERIRNEPNRDARLLEEQLGLTRDVRRQVQRNLTLLGDEPQGVDGVFGPASRAAISRFQTRNGFPGTGFLTDQQIARLALQAEGRQAELQAQEKRRQLARERQDREAWSAIGEGRDEAGLRTYLDRYPDGIHAAIARERLSRIEDETAARAREVDERDWKKADETRTVAVYKAYLKSHPSGAHATTARKRIEVMQAETSVVQTEARATEADLGLTPVTRLLVEQRLDQLGHAPGAIDGEFDADTRAAIRQFQAARGLEVTGYMDGDVVTQMLSDIGRLVRPGQ